MAIEKIIDINVNAQPAEEATKSLRAQLRAAQQDVARLSDEFGATSKEAIEAAKRAAELADKIGDAKALTDAFNPDAKFKALTASLSGVASGFAAVQGAMGLFGAESESVEKTLLKVQSAMALASGLQAVGESVDSFKQLAAVVQSFSVVQKISTAAQWLWNAAMAANPIGAILTAIVAVIAAGYQLIKFFMDSAEANETAMAATQKNTQALKEQQEQFAKSSKTLAENNKFQYDMAKASGVSSEALRKLALANAREEEALAKKNTMLARATFLRERDTLATLRSNDASDEAIEAQEKLTQETWKEFEKQRDNYYKQKDAVVNIQRQQAVEVRQAQTDARKKEEEDAKTAWEKKQEKEKERREKAREELKKQHEEDLKALKEFQKATLDAEMTEREERFKAREEEDARFKQTIEDLNAWENEQENEKLKQDQARAELKRAIEESYVGFAESTIGSLRTIFSKNKEIQKGLLIAESAVGIAKIVINTQEANAKAVAISPITSGQPFVALNLISAGLGIAANVAATAKALGALGGGGAPTNGASSLPRGGAGGGTNAPQFNIVGDAGVNSLTGAVQSNRQTPVQAYVVAQNVTSAQSLNRNIVESATLG
jgi:hypothetical protein